MPAVASDVPPEPPAEITPPIPRSRSIQRPNASAIAVTDCAAIAGKDRAGAVRMHRGDLNRRHVGARDLARGREIDGPHRDIQRAQAVANEAQLGALGVESADDQSGAPDALGERDGEHGSRRARCLRLRQAPSRGRCARPSGWAGLSAPIDRRSIVGARRRPVRETRKTLASPRARIRRGVLRPAAPASSPCRPTPSRRCWRSRSRASSPASMMRLIAAIDHDRDGVGNGRGDADILLDDEDRKVLFAGQADQQIAHLRDDDRRETLGRLVHDQQARIAEQARARSPASAARRPKAGRRHCLAFGQAREGRIDPLDASTHCRRRRRVS